MWQEPFPGPKWPIITGRSVGTTTEQPEPPLPDTVSYSTFLASSGLAPDSTGPSLAMSGVPELDGLISDVHPKEGSVRGWWTAFY